MTKETGPCAECDKEAPLKCTGCKMVHYCDVACQKKHWKKHKDDCRCYNIVDSEGKGKGMVARRKIEEGEIIVKEKPLFVVKTPYAAKHLVNHLAEIRKNVMKLEEEQRDAFYELALARPELCTKGPGDSKLFGVFQANSIELTDLDRKKTKTLGAALFLNISRINHSCLPNAVWSYNLSKRVLEVRASRPIAEDEEVLICYADSSAMREDRRKYLEARFNFQCDCKVCSLTGEDLVENEKLRKEIMGLTNNMEDIYKDKPEKALKYAKMKLERMEKIKRELISWFPQIYMDCYELCMELGEDEIGRIYAHKGKQVANMIRGENALFSKLYLTTMLDKEKFLRLADIL